MMSPLTNAKLRVMEGLVTPVIPAAVLSGNPDAQSLLFAPFNKGGEKEKRFLLSVEMTKASCMISAC